MPAIKNFTIRRGETFVFEVKVSDENGDAVDLTGATLDMHARTSRESDTIVIDFDSLGALSFVDASIGHMQVALTAAQTAALEAPHKLVYDLKVTKSSGDVSFYLAGKLTIEPQVTR
jgi:hypothetical protein